MVIRKRKPVEWGNCFFTFNSIQPFTKCLYVSTLGWADTDGQGSYGPWPAGTKRLVGKTVLNISFSIRGFDQLTIRPGAMRPKKGGDQHTGNPTGLLSSSQNMKARETVCKVQTVIQGEDNSLWWVKRANKCSNPKERDNKHPNHQASAIRRSTRTFRYVRMRTGSGVPQTDPACHMLSCEVDVFS